MPSQIAPPPWPWRHRGFVLATAATAAAFVGYHLLERPAPAAPAPVVIAVPTVVPVSAPITAPITVHVPPPPPAPAAPPAPPAPAPHALTPRLDAECLVPGDDPNEDRGRCDWDDGLPAISQDGATIAVLQFPGDGGRGYPSIVVDFIDTASSRRKTVTLLAPDETDEGTVTPALRATVARRVASVQRQLDAGDYRALREIPRPAIEGTEPPTSGLSAEIEGDAVRVIDHGAHAVVFHARFPVGAEYAPVVLRDDDSDAALSCTPTHTREIMMWSDPKTATLIAQVSYGAGPCYCDDAIHYYVRKAAAP